MEVNIRRIKPQDSPQKFKTIVYRMWNIQPSPFARLANGQFKSIECTWYFDTKGDDEGYNEEFPWNVQPWDDEAQGVPRIFEWVGRDLEHDEDNFCTTSEESVDTESSGSSSAHSVVSVDLFKAGTDDILLEGELFKFKPGLSCNFIPRYVQISQRAFRYFRSRYEASRGKPIVAFRKRIVKAATVVTINKASYLKPGSRVAQSHQEDHLFDNMFEVLLHEDYEDNYDYRDEERAKQDAAERKAFEQARGVKKVTTQKSGTFYRPSSRSGGSALSSRDKDEDSPFASGLFKSSSGAKRSAFRKTKAATFAFGESPPTAKQESPLTAGLLRSKGSGLGISDSDSPERLGGRSSSPR